MRVTGVSATNDSSPGLGSVLQPCMAEFLGEATEHLLRTRRVSTSTAYCYCLVSMFHLPPNNLLSSHCRLRRLSALTGPALSALEPLLPWPFSKAGPCRPWSSIMTCSSLSDSAGDAAVSVTAEEPVLGSARRDASLWPGCGASGLLDGSARLGPLTGWYRSRNSDDSSAALPPAAGEDAIDDLFRRGGATGSCVAGRGTLDGTTRPSKRWMRAAGEPRGDREGCRALEGGAKSGERGPLLLARDEAAGDGDDAVSTLWCWAMRDEGRLSGSVTTKEVPW